MLAAALAVGVLALVVWSVVQPRRRRAEPRLLHQGAAAVRRDRAAASRRRSSARCCSSRSRPRSRCPFGVLTAIYVSEFAPERIGRQIRLWLDVLNGVPVDRDRHLRLHAHRQGAAAGPRLGPSPERDRRRASRSRSSCCRSSRARRWRCSRSCPNHLREASYALGVSKWQTVLRVVLPTSLRRHPHRHDARDRPRRRRDGAAPLHLRDRRPDRRLEPGALGAVDPADDLPVLRVGRPEPAPAGLGGGVRADHVRARHEPHRAPAARALAAQARAHALAAFTTPSPGRHTASAHVAAATRAGWRRQVIAPPGTKEKTSMKRGLALIGVAAVARAPHGRGRRREEQRHDDHGRGQHVRPAARLGLDAGARLRRSVTHVQYSGVGSGAGIAAITNKQVDFGASDAPLTPDQATACGDCVQIPWALSATAVAYNVPGAPVAPEPRRSDDLEDLPRSDHELERSGDRRAEQGREPAESEDHAGLPLGRLGHVVQLHRLPVVRERRRGRRRSASRRSRRSRRVRAPRARAASPALISRTSGAIGYVDVAYAIKNHIQVRGRPERGREVPLSRASGGSRPRLLRVPEGAGEQRDAHREPAEVGAARVPDQHLHLRDRATRRRRTRLSSGR